MTARVPDNESLPLSAELRIDAVCQRFEAAWQAVVSGGARPAIEAYLVAAAQSERAALLRQLLALELHYREQWGERPTREEYRSRFPEHGELLESLFAIYAEAESLHAPEPDESGTASSVPGQETGPELPSTGSAERPELPSIPGYEILGELGRGGMGVVYKARHTRLKRSVALKMILGGALVGPEHLARFRTEAEAVARLQHPHIVQIYEIGEHNGLPFLALEFVDGGSLSARLAGNPQQPAEAARVVETLAGAMHAAHQAGVVHRDLKPANVLLTTSGAPKVTDFGLAKQLDDPSGQTQPGAIMGTPSYMAPEQAAGDKDIGPAADVYALGAILYECLTGRPPFRGATVLDTLEQVRTQEPVPPRALQPNLPRDLETVCLKCLQKEPARRYGSAAELAADLRRFQEGKPILARPVGRLERAVKWARRRPAAAAFLAALIIGTVVSTSLAVYARQKAEQASGNAAAATNAKNDLVAANTQLSEANTHLQEANTHLEQANTRLETTMAHSLLVRLAVQPGPPTDEEIDVLWELVENPGERLWYRFVEESLRTPVTTGKLRTRKDLAFHAALGLDLDKRDQVEKLLVGRLQRSDLDEGQRTDEALFMLTLGNLTPAAQATVTRVLPHEMTKKTLPVTSRAELARGLAAAAVRLDPKERADILVQAMLRTFHPTEVAELANGLAAVADCLEPKEAAQAADIITFALDRTTALFTTSDKERHAAQMLRAGLVAVATRLDSQQAVAILTQPRERHIPDPSCWELVASGLSAVATRLERKDPVRAADSLTGRLVRPSEPSSMFGLVLNLSAVATRLEPEDAAGTARRLSQTLVETTEPTHRVCLVLCLMAVGARLEPMEAADAAEALFVATCTSQDQSFKLPGNPDALVARVDTQGVARATETLIQAILSTRNFPETHPWTIQGLSTLSVRLAPDKAAKLAGNLIAAMAVTKDESRHDRRLLAECLRVIAARMEPKDAARAYAQAADTLTQGMAMTKTTYVLGNLAQALSVVAASLEAQEGAHACARAAHTLTQATAKPIDIGQLRALAQGLAAVTDRLEQKEAAAVCTPVAARLAQGMSKTTNDMELIQLAQGLSAVAVRLDPKEGADILVQAMLRTTHPGARGELAKGLPAVAVRLEPKEVARTAEILREVMLADTMGNGELCADGLSVVAARLETQDADRLADTLTQAMVKESTSGYPRKFRALARVLSAVAARREAKDAAQAAESIIGAMTSVCKRDVKNGNLPALADSLVAVGSRLQPIDTERAVGSLMHTMALTANDQAQVEVARDLPALLTAAELPAASWRAAAVPAAIGPFAHSTHPIVAVAMLAPAWEPQPCRLSSQQLVELLKQPVCVRQARRVILDQLQNRYHRKFADHWEFVRFAQEQHLELDFTSPPKRPVPTAAPAR
jgi:hypothetical protein